MSYGSIFSRIRRWRTWAALAGTTVAAVPGCDPDVQNVLVTGMQNAVNAAAAAVIDAIFQSVTPDGDGGLPTVMLDTLHQAVGMLA